MAKLPAALRPNPYAIDDEVLQLADNGWSPDQVVEYVVRDGSKQPGHVVHSIRGMLDLPNPNVQHAASTRPVGHQPCPEHGDPCELCYCRPGEARHHVTVPTPDWYTHALEAAPTHPGGLQGAMDDGLRSQGIDPDRLRHHLDHGQPGDADAYLATLGIQ